jgi:hypothetical protein
MLNGTMAIQSLHPYPWESVYKAAVFEPDSAKVEERVEVAEEGSSRDGLNSVSVVRI